MNAPEQTLVLANAKARYTFTSRGGGVKLIELLAYPQTISARWTRKSASSSAATADRTRGSMPKPLSPSSASPLSLSSTRW